MDLRFSAEDEALREEVRTFLEEGLAGDVAVARGRGGIETRPIHQLTGDSEFNEVFLTGARTAAVNIVGEPDAGWRVAMGTLAFERGASTLGQNLMFLNEWDEVLDAARRNGRIGDPLIRQRLVDTCCACASCGATPCGSCPAPTRHRLQRWSPSCSGRPCTATWASWPWTCSAPTPRCARRPSRTARPTTAGSACSSSAGAAPIYAGTNEIQRDIIGERALGLPKEPS